MTKIMLYCSKDQHDAGSLRNIAKTYAEDIKHKSWFFTSNVEDVVLFLAGVGLIEMEKLGLNPRSSEVIAYILDQIERDEGCR